MSTRTRRNVPPTVKISWGSVVKNVGKGFSNMSIDDIAKFFSKIELNTPGSNAFNSIKTTLGLADNAGIDGVATAFKNAGSSSKLKVLNQIDAHITQNPTKYSDLGDKLQIERNILIKEMHPDVDVALTKMSNELMEKPTTSAGKMTRNVYNSEYDNTVKSLEDMGFTQKEATNIVDKSFAKKITGNVDELIPPPPYKGLTNTAHIGRMLDDMFPIPPPSSLAKFGKYAGKPFKWAKENPGRAFVYFLEFASLAMGVIFILNIFGLDMDFLSPDGNKSKKCDPEDWLDPECMDTLAQSPMVQAIAGGCCSLSVFCCVMVCMCSMMMTMQSSASSKS